MNPRESFDPKKPLGPSRLAQYLREAANSVGREKTFNYRLYFDLKLAAALGNYHLQVFQPDVDKDGYDLVLEDGNQPS